MTTFFTSDLHFSHKNIRKYSPKYRAHWATTEEMDAGLIEYWNNTVSKTDTVYHLGDFCFGNQDKVKELLGKLNGTIILIRGNHDKVFNHEYLEIKLNNKSLILFHYPITSWNRMHYGTYHLHGHTHGSFEGQGNILDVGWDAHGKFLTIYDIEILMQSKAAPVKVDHHG